MAVTIIYKAHSNKSKTLQEKSKQDYDEIPPAGTLIPFIDKLSVVVPILSADAEGIFNNLWTQLNDVDVFQDAGSKSKWGPFKVAKRICLTNTVARPLFQLAYAAKKAVKCRLDFNPRKVGEHGMMELDAVLISILPDGWKYVVTHGHITRIDIAVNIPNSRPSMFAFLPQQGLTTKEWAVNGKLETFVAGKKKGHQTAVYNKKKQRQAQGHKWIGKSVVRVERRLRNPSIGGLSGLLQLPNPFIALELIEMPGPPATEKKPWIWEIFKDSVTVRGLPAVLALLPLERRTAYRTHLKQHPHKLWDPISIWKNWPKALEILK
jgi:hypothetical protein